jgi:hypothetical protein
VRNISRSLIVNVVCHHFLLSVASEAESFGRSGARTIIRCGSVTNGSSYELTSKPGICQMWTDQHIRYIAAMLLPN